jgi:uncharacterized protein (DUF924 family)
VPEFWFCRQSRERWFNSTPAFDAAIRTRFGTIREQARDGQLAGLAWCL